MRARRSGPAGRIARLAFAAGLLSAAPSATSVLAAAVGRVVGNLDGIAYDGEQAFISGWACQQGRTESIPIHIYANPTPADPQRSVFLSANKTNFDNEPGVNTACQEHEGRKHRFFAALPFGYREDSKLFVHGIRVVNGVSNDAIAGSGLPLRHFGTPQVPYQAPTVPPIAGSYHSLATHPRVFTTAAELEELVARINRPSYSAKRFQQLAAQVARDLAAPNDWDVAYSGCFVGVYLYAFSYEPQDGHDAETHAALKLGPDIKAPAGAAVVTARLALYAALAKDGAELPTGAPNPDRAVALAKRILLAWADHGLPRDAHGGFRSLEALSCDANGKIDQGAGSFAPLHLGRGVIYSVHAQDLLQSFGALDADEARRLDAFHGAVFELIRQGANRSMGFPQPACQRFTNGGANGLAALLAIARLLDDARKFNAVLSDDDRGMVVLLPWRRFLDGAIYGNDDHPLECYLNTGPDALTSHPGFTTASVAPGEVQDRYRNMGLLQTFGYAMFTLERLIDSAESLRNAGFDPYRYRGNHGQSIELAIHYYACYGKTPGFYRTVSRDNAQGCTNHAQYDGKVVNGVDANVVVGAYRFPGNSAIAAAEGPAKEASTTGAFALDPIRFGKWRD